MPDLHKKFTSIAAVLVLVLGLGVSLALVRQRQLVEAPAAVPGGVASLRLDPSSANLSVGGNQTVSAILNTGNAQTDGFQVIARYNYVGAQPEIEIPATSVSGVPGSLQCLANSISNDTGAKQITIIVSCITAPGGGTYSTNGSDQTIFTFPLRANASGSIAIGFDDVSTKVNDFGTGTDILGIPTGGTYTVDGAPAPTNTTVPNPTNTTVPDPDPTNTSVPVPTNTSVPQGGSDTPNSCGGTCGSNSNCQSQFICYQGFCRNPSCVTSTNCTCSVANPTAIPTTRPASTGVPTIKVPTPTTSTIAYVTTTTSPNPFLQSSPASGLPQIEYVEPEPAAPQGFWARLFAWISNLFRSLFGRK